MFQHSLILICLLLMVSALVARSRRGTVPEARPRNARASAAARAIVSQRVARPNAAPVPTALEWTAPNASDSATPTTEEVQARLRDRYIVARFPGTLKSIEGLREVEQVINVARLYFEESKLDRAHELIDLAVAETPADKSLRLAGLELAFLSGDPVHFTELARAFQGAIANASEWSEVCRLGRALAPLEPLFGAAPGVLAHSHSHYGPWPDTPNWIQASWDLTGEVLAVDFHRALARRHDETAAPPLRRVA
jgi:hypothetical protein